MSDNLPPEIVAKILAKVPPKSLIKFKCVSKSWNSLISSPEFILLHTKQAILSNSLSHDTSQILVRRFSIAHNTEVYTVHSEDGDLPDDKSIRIEYPFRDNTDFYFRVVGSCNGVLCLLDDFFGQPESILLWNPAIKRQFKVSVIEKTPSDMFVVGFGFDAENHYKVVRIAYVLEDFGYLVPPKVEVYSLSKGSWHTVEGEIPKTGVVEYFWSQVFINGNVHWVAYKDKGRHVKVDNLIMLFDMTLEVFDEMQLPDALKHELPINLLAVDLQGSIGVVQYDERISSKRCSIWVMKKYQDPGSWCKQYNVDLEGGIGMILGLRTNGDILVTVKNRGLVSYNPVTGKSVDLGLFGTKDSFYVGPYFETLALLAEGKEARERIPSDSDDDYGGYIICDSSVEDDEDQYGDVEKSEFWKQSYMAQFLTALLKRSAYMIFD